MPKSPEPTVGDSFVDDDFGEDFEEQIKLERGEASFERWRM
jgi:hypothetical protein